MNPEQHFSPNQNPEQQPAFQPESTSPDSSPSSAQFEQFSAADAESKKARTALNPLNVLRSVITGRNEKGEKFSLKETSHLTDNEDFVSSVGFFGAQLAKDKNDTLYLSIDQDTTSTKADRLFDRFVRNFDDHRQSRRPSEYYQFFAKHPTLYNQYIEASNFYGDARSFISKSYPRFIQLLRAGDPELKQIVDEQITTQAEAQAKTLAAEKGQPLSSDEITQLYEKVSVEEWEKVFNIALPGPKRHRNFVEALHSSDNLGLSDHYQEYRNDQGEIAGIKFADPEIFKKGIFLADILNMDTNKMKTKDPEQIARLQSFYSDPEQYHAILEKTAQYLGSLHHQNKAVGEVLPSDFFFTKLPDQADTEVILGIPDIVFNEDKNLSVVEKQAIDLSDWLLGLSVMELKRQGREHKKDSRPNKEAQAQEIDTKVKDSLVTWLKTYLESSQLAPQVLAFTLRQRERNRIAIPQNKAERLARGVDVSAAAEVATTFHNQMRMALDGMGTVTGENQKMMKRSAALVEEALRAVVNA